MHSHNPLTPPGIVTMADAASSGKINNIGCIKPETCWKHHAKVLTAYTVSLITCNAISTHHLLLSDGTIGRLGSIAEKCNRYEEGENNTYIGKNYTWYRPVAVCPSRSFPSVWLLGYCHKYWCLIRLNGAFWLLSSLWEPKQLLLISG